MQFIDLYKRALTKYIAQDDRTHYSLKNKPECPIFTFGIFSWLRHSREEYKELLDLRSILEKDKSDDQSVAIAAIKKHFSDEKNKWNNHSFNSYFLDEIEKNSTVEEWRYHWQKFDPRPIQYYHGLLFRGTGDSPQYCFEHGLSEKNTSASLDDYISTVNGSIGVSTSKDFFMAEAYALPIIDPRHDTYNTWEESYIYLIDYQQDLGIDLEKTFLQRGQTIRASLSADKAEVNVIKHIAPSQIIGAFYVNRSGAIEWQNNKNYSKVIDDQSLSKFQKSLPIKYYNELARHYSNSVLRLSF